MSPLSVFALFFIFGFSFWNTVGGKYEGDKIESSLRFAFGDYFFHLHHWLYSLALIMALYYVDFSGIYAYGFLAGSVIQGFFYRDWYLILYRKDMEQQIYSKWNQFAEDSGDIN